MKQFPGLPNLIQELHDNNYKFVPIVDIGFPKNEIDEYYNKMITFLKNSGDLYDVLTISLPSNFESLDKDYGVKFSDYDFDYDKLSDNGKKIYNNKLHYMAKNKCPC